MDIFRLDVYLVKYIHELYKKSEVIYVKCYGFTLRSYLFSAYSK